MNAAECLLALATEAALYACDHYFRYGQKLFVEGTHDRFVDEPTDPLLRALWYRAYRRAYSAFAHGAFAPQARARAHEVLVAPASNGAAPLGRLSTGE